MKTPGNLWPDLAHLQPLAADDRPLSERIAERIREAIDRGDYRQGTRLPGTPAIARHYNVGRRAADAAVARLDDEGVVRLIRGTGAFVRGAS
jgi:GntR family transcriptional regulator